MQANQSYWWTEAEVNERLRTRMDRAWEEVTDFSKDHGLSLRTAATTMAAPAAGREGRARRTQFQVQPTCARVSPSNGRLRVPWSA
ncbi:hypothetical protein [uncultured Actinomyces sp.]|uniref:hypothetical protein n=1 Tax=uncultured Actinomyces sp. TaxID=249061 RepID=UPI0025CDE12F|nr:hypothetical protein [uncultured Actinomyces sp.]